MVEACAPANFDLLLQEKWSRWVIVHGLPDLPGSDLDVDQAVPVAYCVGPTTAAVLHIRRYVDEDLEDDDRLITETDIDLFCLAGSVWESWGGGGGGWTDTAPLARYEVPPDYVDLSGMNSGSMGDHGCKALSGLVGVEAASAEVIQGDQVTRRTVQAPTGAFVVCAEIVHPFTVRVLNAEGDVLAEIQDQAGA